MPPRNKRFRALKEEFRQLLDQRASWPPVKTFPAVLEGKGGGRKADIFDMKDGAVVAEKFSVVLVELLWNKPVLAEFLTHQGVKEHERLTVDQVVDLVAEPAQAYAAPAVNEIDWYMEGLDGLVGLFNDYIWENVVRPGMLCECEEDVRDAVAMILSELGRHIRGARQLSNDEAIRIAERHMMLSQDDYLARAFDLWRKEKWTFGFGVVDRQRVACSCILPLRDSIYEEVYHGKRNSHSCLATEITVPSQTLLFEAVAQRADVEYASIAKKTGQAIRTFFVQMAKLSLDVNAWKHHETKPLRILSFAGSPTNEKRLKRLGFRPTGTQMHGFGIPFYELDEQKGWFFRAVIHKLQERLIETGVV